MRKEKKTELTKERIIKAALQEFGTNGYDATTLNSICSKHDIAKGLLYHNFKGKDEVYLTCVEECFNSLTDYLKCNIDIESSKSEDLLKAYLTARLSFFHSNPLFQRIFCDAVIFPPSHLQEDIKKIKQDFDNLNTKVFSTVITHLNLRSDVSEKEAIETFRQYQDFINASYRLVGAQEIDLESHEERCHRALNILLYGIIERQ